MGDAAKDENADWVSVSDLAKARGVSHQAISKRVRSLSRRGTVPMRRAGKVLLIHRPSFEALAVALHDPAQDLRNRPRIPEAMEAIAQPISGAILSMATPLGDDRSGAYDDAAAREKNAKAALAEMELAKRRAELVPARDLEEACVKAATALGQRISALKSKFGQLYAAARGGEEALRVALNAEVDELSRAIAADMAALASNAGAPEETPGPN
ncbi:hypothetical protein [Methylocystis parvus]|uniref:hypothetical protein n=1 Tax=Methylocystis parvus TaxID=134 RepID=UPI003C7965AC